MNFCTLLYDKNSGTVFFLYDQTNRRVTVDAENEVLKNYECPFVIYVSPANG